MHGETLKFVRKHVCISLHQASCKSY